MAAEATLLRAANGARILEAVDNYALAGIDAAEPDARAGGGLLLYDDRTFWQQVLEKQLPFGSPVEIVMELVVSEWVARVPGLFWTPSAKGMRERGEREQDRRLGQSALFPVGKSSVVSGGVGTMKLAPSENGYRLCTLVSSANVSAGVPALIAPDVWERHRLAEGTVVEIDRMHATWQGMTTAWAQHFPSTRGVPRGYVRVDDPSAVKVQRRDAATEIHPFTIMQYYKNNVELYDFVFATAVTGDPRHRRYIAEFFDDYREIDGRMGRFLLHADVAHPMWDAVYASPAELEQAQRQVTQRIEDAMVGSNVTEELLDLLVRLGDPALIRRLSVEIGISDAIWFQGGPLTAVANDFVQRVPRAKVPQLLDAIRVLNPDLLEIDR